MKTITTLLLLLIPLISFSAQPAPTSFEFNENGEVFGELEDGSKFSQTKISSELKIQKFEWDEGFWYITDQGIIEAESDLDAVIKYLGL